MRNYSLWPKTRRFSGFTIPEVLLSMLVLTVGLGGILALLTHTHKKANVAINDSDALTTVYSIAEQIRSMPMSELTKYGYGNPVDFPDMLDSIPLKSEEGKDIVMPLNRWVLDVGIPVQGVDEFHTVVDVYLRIVLYRLYGNRGPTYWEGMLPYTGPGYPAPCNVVAYLIYRYRPEQYEKVTNRSKWPWDKIVILRSFAESY